MKLFVLIIVLAMAAIGGFLGWRVLGLMKKNKRLKADKIRNVEIYNELREENVKLKKELDKYSDVEIKVALTDNEKQMILDALDSPQYKAKVEDPKTNYFIREIYRNLKEKVKESIKK